MARVIIILFLFIACSCAGQKTSTKSKRKQKENKPAWLSAKPVQAGFYIGIGHSYKDGTSNYIQTAKKSALEDLVSEIKVNISSTSILSQIDLNKEFQEKYEQIIQTTAADEIEEFEQVEAWEDAAHYWVYYRLSKQRYKEIKDLKKKNAVDLALDFFTKAKMAERNSQLSTSLGFYYQGFRAIEKYLDEPIRLDFEGKEILLTNEIIANMQYLLDKIDLTLEPKELMLNRRMTQNETTIMVKTLEKQAGKPIIELPLYARFEKGAGDVFPTYKTDVTGKAKVLLSKISARDIEQSVVVGVDILSFATQADPIYALIVSKMNIPAVRLLMKVQRPLVFLSSIEKSFGIEKTSQQISNNVKNFLTSSGFEFTNDKTKAELMVDIISDAEKGAVSGSIYITYLTAVIRVTAIKDNKEIYTTTLDRIKGFSLDYDRSSQEAYNKSLVVLEKEKLPELLNAILQ